MTYFPVPQDLPPAIGTNITYCKKKRIFAKISLKREKVCLSWTTVLYKYKAAPPPASQNFKNDFVSKDLLKTTPAPVECHDKLFIEIYTSGF